MDVPTASNTLLFAGLSTVDFSIADVSTTIIPLAAEVVLKDISRLVEFEPMTRRTNDAVETQFVLAHKYISDSEFSSFDLTVTVDDVVVFDSPDYDDVSGVTLTVSSIDALQGFVTLETATSQTVYASYRWAPVRIQGGSTDQLLVLAVMHKTAEMMWDAIIGSGEMVTVGDYRIQNRNRFRDLYNQSLRKVNARVSFRVTERKAALKDI